MCGISIIVGCDTSKINKSIKSIDHRGPDWCGIKRYKINDQRHIALAHARLSIVDQSDKSNQPMESNCGRYCLVFNGEIYNFRDLSEKYKIESYGSDTIFLLGFLIRFGVDKLNELNGMWAFALFDRVNFSLLLSRDRLGKKPLYIYDNGNYQIIGSEEKAILAATDDKFSINTDYVSQYLAQGILEYNKISLFKEINQVKPGHSLKLDLLNTNVKFKSVPYWNYERKSLNNPSKMQDQRLLALFSSSVEMRMTADAKLGILFSGGLDSTAILTIASKLNISKINVYSVISDDPSQSEEKYIDLVANSLGIVVNKINVSVSPDEMFDLIGEVSYYCDGPILGFANVAHYLIMKKAHADGVKVLITGQGSDEQLGGYNKYPFRYMIDLYKDKKYKKLIKAVAMFVFNSRIFHDFDVTEAVRYLENKNTTAYSYIKESYINTEKFYCGDLDSLLINDVTKYSLPALLHFEDRIPMSKSIEMRAPFVDFRLVDFFSNIAHESLFRGGRTKSFFRRAMRGIVVDEIVNRRDKKGFNVPDTHFVKTVLRNRFCDVFNSDMILYKLGVIDKTKLTYAYSQFCKGNSKLLNGRSFFRVFALEMTLQKFSGNLS